MGGDPASKGISPSTMVSKSRIRWKSAPSQRALENWKTGSRVGRVLERNHASIHLNVSCDDKIKSCHILNYIYILIISIAIYHAHIVDTENVYIFYVDLALKIT